MPGRTLPAALLLVAAAGLVIAVRACGLTDREPDFTPARSPWQSFGSYDVAGRVPSGPATLRFSLAGDLTAVWPIARVKGRFGSGVLSLDSSGNLTRARNVRLTATDAPRIDPGGRTTFVGYALQNPGAGASRLTTSVASPTADVANDVPRTVTRQLSRGGAAIGNSALATGPGGAAVLAWVEFLPAAGQGDRARLRAAIAEPVSASESSTIPNLFGRPITLQAGTASRSAYSAKVAVALGSGGEVLVASDRLSRATAGVVAWSRGPNEHVLAGPVRLAQSAASSSLRAAVTSEGRAVVATTEKARSGSSPWALRAATFAADAANPEIKQQLLAPGSATAFPLPGLQLCADGERRATLAWNSVEGTDTAAMVATTDEAGQFTEPERLASPAEIGGLACSGDGAAAITLGNSFSGTPSDSRPQAIARIRPNGDEEFGPAEFLPIPASALTAPFDTSGTLEPGGLGSTVLDRAIPAPVFDPRTGRLSLGYVEASTATSSARVTLLSRNLP